MTIDPAEHFVFTANDSGAPGSKIDVLTVEPSIGALTAVPGKPLAAGGSPIGADFHRRSGRCQHGARRLRHDRAVPSRGFHGSSGNIHFNQPIVGMASSVDGRSYWQVAADGEIFT